MNKGFIIGLIISAVLIIINILAILAGGGGHGPPLYFYTELPLSWLLSILGLDYFLALLGILGTPYPTLILGSIVFLGFTTFIGFLFDEKYSNKRKLIFLIILLLIFTPLSSYTHYLKYNDGKIISNYNGGWVNINQEICDDLSLFNENRKYDCYLSLSRSLIINKEICNKISGIDNIDCNNNLAKKTGDSSNCGSNPECYIFAATKSSNVNLCETLKSHCQENCNFWFSTCISEVALSTGNFRICGKDYNCISLVAIDKKDKTICNYIEESISKNRCYEDIMKGMNVSKDYNSN